MVSILMTRPLWQTCAIILLVTASVVGCKSPQLCCDPGLTSRELACRTGITPQRVSPCQQVIPPGVFLEDGLSEDEAVQVALSNNSAFQATLAQLGMAHGDAVQASLLMNPQFLVYFPTGTKEGQYTLFAPIESYLLRPTRVKVANREYRRIGETLVQNGLDLARNVRVAYADLAVATQQAELARWRKLGVRKLSFASAEVTRELTGQEIGGVTIFGLPDGLSVWLDARVLECSSVVVGAGSRSAKIRLDPRQLVGLDRYEFVDDLASIPES